MSESNDTGGGTEKTRLDEMLESPLLRQRLEELVEEAAEDRGFRRHWRRLNTFVAGASSAAVVLLAFFIPSLQDQWDRWQSRTVVRRYEELGRQFMGQKRFEQAEQAFGKALELSENRRLDLDEERLNARVQRMQTDSRWGVENPEGIEEGDFLYLLAFRPTKGRERERAAVLDCYGAFLAGEKRWREAEGTIREAIALDPSLPVSHLYLGNLLRDLGKAPEAEAEYRKVVSLDPKEMRGHYNLGLLLAEGGRRREAEEEFRRAAALRPDDPDAIERLAEQVEAAGRTADARELYRRVAALAPDDAEARQALGRLR